MILKQTEASLLVCVLWLYMPEYITCNDIYKCIILVADL